MKTNPNRPPRPANPFVRGIIEGLREAPRAFFAPAVAVLRWAVKLVTRRGRSGH